MKLGAALELDAHPRANQTCLTRLVRKQLGGYYSNRATVYVLDLANNQEKN
jgi:hypothetical protein